MDVQRLMAALPTLTSAELAQVKARAEFLLKTVNGRRVVPDDWLYTGLCMELERRGIRPAPTRNDDPALKRYAEDAAAVRQFLAKAAGGALVNGEKTALARLAGRALYDYLMPVIPRITLKNLMQNIGKVPQALDESYPGYCASRMLRMLIRSTR